VLSEYISSFKYIFDIHRFSCEMSSAKPKKKKNKTKFNESYQEKYPWVWPIKHPVRDEHKARCTVCHCDFSVSHGGIDDVKKHGETDKHLSNNSQMAGTSTIRNFLPSVNDLDIVRAETLMAEFIVEHNLPFAVADHASRLVKKMFPDSKIAAKYACGQTKTSCIVRTLAANDEKDIVQALRSGPFSLATDGSQDYSDTKLYPVVVRYFDDVQGQLVCTILDMPSLKESSTGENIFRLMDTVLTSKEISWQNCVSFACDNANVMMGQHKGVVAYLHQKNPETFVVGCPCHLIALAAGKAANALPVKVDDFIST
jgi:hypothetical protein